MDDVFYWSTKCNEMDDCVRQSGVSSTARFSKNKNLFSSDRM